MLPPIRSQFLALLILTGLIVVVERLIVTDAEAIRALGQRAAKAAAARDMEALGQLLAPDFRHGTRDRAETLEHVAGLLRRYPAGSIEIDLHAIEVTDDRATAKGLVALQVMGRPYHVQVDVELVEGEDGWQFARVKGGESYR